MDQVKRRGRPPKVAFVESPGEPRPEPVRIDLPGWLATSAIPLDRLETIPLTVRGLVESQIGRFTVSPYGEWVDERGRPWTVKLDGLTLELSAL